MYELGQLYMNYWRPCIQAEMIYGSKNDRLTADEAKATEWFGLQQPLLLG